MMWQSSFYRDFISRPLRSDSTAQQLSDGKVCSFYA